MTDATAPTPDGLSRREAIGAAASVALTTGTGAAARAAAPVQHAAAEPDALALAEMVRRRTVSPLELLEAAIRRAEVQNARYNFLSQRHYDYGRAAIERGLPEGPFTGVPFLEKDLNTFIAGELTEQGSRYYAGNRATVTSELVKRHERAGLVIFGKTTVPEFGLSATTESILKGQTRNPWNPEYSSGGSSGGASAAVSSGVIPIAHATDGGGSIRVPASCCGLFGLKPSRGRVPMGPPRSEGWGGMSTHHAISVSVRDSAALLDATHGIEPGSRYGAPTPRYSYLSEVTRAPGRLRIALATTSPTGSPVDPECADAARQAARLCESLGHHVEEAFPSLDYAALARAAFTIISTSIATDLQARGTLTGVPPSLDVLEPMTFAFYQMGLRTSGRDVVAATNDLLAAALAMSQFMDRYDLLLSPTLATPPVRLGVLALAQTDMATFSRAISTYGPFTALENQTGQPSMSVPMAMSRNGLPIGVMFTARYGEEGTLFRVAGQLERAAPWAGRRAPMAL